MKNHNGESLSGKSVNCKNPFTHSPIHRFAHSPIHSPRRVARGDPFTSNKGFTLIELVITMVLIGIIAYVVATALSTGIKAYFTTDFRKEALDQSRIAMERMTREIRNLRDSSSVIASSPIQFNFTDINGNAINFIWTSPNITRNADTLATNITTFSFGYVRGDNGVSENTFSTINTKRIRITLTATKNNESVTLQSEVWPRSL